MKYTTEIELNLPLNRVIELFDNPQNMPKWQPGLISFEHIEGNPGREGAQSKLKYKMGKREIEMIETIIIRNLPHEFSGTYKAPGVFNLVKNYFSEAGPDKTRWIVKNEFAFQGIMGLWGLLMPGMFKKQSFKYMQQFKEFAEKEN